MRILANIIWHIPFMGFLSALIHMLIGGFFIITVVGAPIGIGLFEYGKFLFAPFSKAMVSKDDLNPNRNEAWKIYSTIVWIFYIPFGLMLWIISIIQVVFLFCTIIGIPLAIVVAKSLSTYFRPDNKKCVSVAVRDELSRMNAQSYIQNQR